MSPSGCPDLETLFLGLEERRADALQHVERCPACAAIVEEHRELERELLRVTDPPPPPDFVQRVMAKVERAPVPMRREVWAGGAILFGSLAATMALAVSSGAAGLFGTELAQALLWVRSFLATAPNAFRAVWETAGLPISVAASLLLMVVLFGLRKIAGSPVEVRVSA
jgi:anti-sigma factor RsiW